MGHHKILKNVNDSPCQTVLAANNPTLHSFPPNSTTASLRAESITHQPTRHCQDALVTAVRGLDGPARCVKFPLAAPAAICPGRPRAQFAPGGLNSTAVDMFYDVLDGTGIGREKIEEHPLILEWSSQTRHGPHPSPRRGHHALHGRQPTRCELADRPRCRRCLREAPEGGSPSQRAEAQGCAGLRPVSRP